MRTAIIILAITILYGCKKNGNDFSSVKNNLISMWELRKMTGGIAGTIIYQPGNGSIVEFKSDNSFVNSEKGNVIRSGTYDLQTTPEKDQYKLTFQTDTYNESQHISLKGDTLVFLATESCCDAPGFAYVRIRP
jgi:hypothetical protein